MRASIEASGVEEVLQAYGRLKGGVLLVIALLIPIWPGAAWFLSVFVLIAFTVETVRKKERFPRPTWGSMALWSMLYFAMHVIGMAWSTNTGFGLFDLEIKAPLLVFALLAWWVGARGRGQNGLVFAFVLGCVAGVMGHIVAALLRATSDAPSVMAEFYSSTFTAPLHPSYLALYLCVAVAAWYLTRTHANWPPWVDLATLLLLCIGVVLSGSKAAWIVLALLLPLLLIWCWRSQRTRTMLLSAIAGSALFVVGLLALLPNARERVKEAWIAATAEEHATDASTSSEVRWITWSAAWSLFKEAPLTGTGTGDIKDELLRVYAERGNTHALERRYNAHDQFLQSAACLGVLGLVTLLAMVLLPVLRPGVHGRLGVVMGLIWLVNLLVESMLEVQAGTVFFGFCMLMLAGAVRNGSSS
jgi:O-antigen ligase